MPADREQAAADLARVGDRVRALRAGAGLTQADLAARVGLDRIALSQLENGHRDMGVSKIIAIARALGVSGSDLLDE